MSVTGNTKALAFSINALTVLAKPIQRAPPFGGDFSARSTYKEDTDIYITDF